MLPTSTERQELARQFAGNVARMRKCLQAAGKKVNVDDIVYAWADYSDGLCASWLMLPESDEDLLAILLKHLPLADRRWIVDSTDAGDGSGDMIVPLPKKLCVEMGWKNGDALSITREDSGDLVLRRVE